MKSKVTLFAISILLLALTTLIYSKVVKSRPAAWVPLVERLPLGIGDWRGVDLPLGETERIQEAVSRLNYEDYIFRRYTRGTQHVYVYAMFWRHGDISIREMAGHTPDGCWVANGAKLVGEKRTDSWYLSDGKRTQKAQVRTFQFSSAQVNVVWWHLWGREVVDSSYGRKTPLTLVSEVWDWLVVRKGESQDQLFVRLHSELPINDLIGAEPSSCFLRTISEVFDK